METILPKLDPTGRAVYLALFWKAHDPGTPSCEISQEPGDPFQFCPVREPVWKPYFRSLRPKTLSNP